MSDNNGAKTFSSGGAGFVGLLTIAFIVLKLTNYIDWDWVWVLSPIWISLLLAILTVLVLVIIFVILAIRSRW